MKRFFPYFFVIIITALLILFPEDAVLYARSSVDLCLDVIIPSLFPFFVCSGLLVYSGITQVLAKISEPVMRPLFNVGGCGSAALVLGVVSGYPQGAVTACQLYESGYLSKTETERLLAFCNNSGPLFILGAVGCAVYKSVKIGVVLYVSHIIATFLVGFLFRFYKRNKHTAPVYTLRQTEDNFAEIFAKVLANSVNSILLVCGSIIFFGVAAKMLVSYLPINDALKAFITGILEIGGGTKAISETALPLIVKLTLSAFIVGFSGLCVHIQVASVTAKHHLSLLPYVSGKLLHAFFAALLTLLYFLFVPSEITVLKSTSAAMSAGFCISSVYSVISALSFLGLGICTLSVTYFASKRREKTE